jgi:putative two-component system hydrogenase maturation factor HypX/HoxX
LLDAVYGPTVDSFNSSLHAHALRLAEPYIFERLLAAKRARLHRDQQIKPLDHYRDHEMTRSHKCFFGTDQRYHHARRQFAYKELAHASRPGVPAELVADPQSARNVG